MVRCLPTSSKPIMHSACLLPFPSSQQFCLCFPRYVKYLYPYECEYEHLSDPQELQTAIESNKRDRRHSENVTEFLTTQNVVREGEKLEQLMGQAAAFTVTGAPSGIQLISSPTVAIPQASMPPYSGSFILTPSGMVNVHTPRLSPHQLLQMTPPHLPIMVPTTQLQEVSGAPVTTMIPVKPEMSTVLEEQRAEEDVQILKRDSSSLLDIERPSAKRVAGERVESPPPAGRLSMPFTNISIKPGWQIITHVYLML